MTLPLATTTVTVQRRSDSAEPYEAETWATASSGVSAHIGQPNGAERNVGGSQEIIDAVLLADAGTDVRHTDRVVDDTDTYKVVWVQARRGLGLNHVEAGLRRVQGLAG